MHYVEKKYLFEEKIFSGNTNSDTFLFTLGNSIFFGISENLFKKKLKSKRGPEYSVKEIKVASLDFLTSFKKINFVF